MATRRDAQARIRLLTPEEGGRQTPVFSGYRPQFYYDGHDWDAASELVGRARAEPGEIIEVYLVFANPQCHVGRVGPGTTFEWGEGTRTVGVGEVLEVVDLETAAAEIIARDPKALDRCRKPGDDARR